MNEKDSKKKHIDTTVFVTALALTSSAIIAIIGYRGGYWIGYAKGTINGADAFANSIVEKCPEAAEILIKAGAIVKR